MLAELNTNINYFKEIQNIENIEVPNFPIEIIDILLKNYPFL